MLTITEVISMYQNKYCIIIQLLNILKIFRFPFIASEIFNCEINQLLDKFFDAPDESKKEAAGSDEEDDEEKHQVNN